MPFQFVENKLGTERQAYDKNTKKALFEADGITPVMEPCKGNVVVAFQGRKFPYSFWAPDMLELFEPETAAGFYALAKEGLADGTLSAGKEKTASPKNGRVDMATWLANRKKAAKPKA